MLNIHLLPRPWSSDRPLVPGVEPVIRARIERVSRSTRIGWRCEILMDGIAMFTSHHPTKLAAESRAEKALDAHAQAHYFQT